MAIFCLETGLFLFHAKYFYTDVRKIQKINYFYRVELTV